MTKKSLSELLKFDGTIYIYLQDSETCLKFYKQAEAEGFMFGDNKPTEKHTTDLIRLYPNKQMSYCTAIGHIAFGSGEAKSGNILRVDYKKFMSGAENYYYSR